jgi:hypothetical protein
LVHTLSDVARYLSKYFPGMVQIDQERGVVLVMDRIRIFDDGRVMGEGPVADRVRELYSQIKLRKDDAEGIRESTARRLRCQHCGILLTGRIYRKRINDEIMLFCCKTCADHHTHEKNPV